MEISHSPLTLINVHNWVREAEPQFPSVACRSLHGCHLHQVRAHSVKSFGCFDLTQFYILERFQPLDLVTLSAVFYLNHTATHHTLAQENRGCSDGRHVKKPTWLRWERIKKNTLHTCFLHLQDLFIREKMDVIRYLPGTFADTYGN